MKRDDIDTRWLPVVGWEGYEVSDTGRVRSLERVRNGRTWPGVEMRGFRSTSGYLVVALSAGHVRRKQALVHRLVLEAFRGPAPPGTLCCHNDGNPLNAELSNLRWDTQSSNIHDCKRHGTAVFGVRHANAKLTPDAVRAIRAGGRTLDLARLFGVSKTSINRIKNGLSWEHVE